MIVTSNKKLTVSWLWLHRFGFGFTPFLCPCVILSSNVALQAQAGSSVSSYSVEPVEDFLSCLAVMKLWFFLIADEKAVTAAGQHFQYKLGIKDQEQASLNQTLNKQFLSTPEQELWH